MNVRHKQPMCDYNFAGPDARVQQLLPGRGEHIDQDAPYVELDF